MTDGLISIIIPVYNAENYIERCLDSILENTYTNFEIICVNDGSKDSSLAILEQYPQKDYRITVLSQENKGVSAARNLGLNKATGEFISFIDADDWIHPQYLEFLFKSIKDADISHCEMNRTNTILPTKTISEPTFQVFSSKDHCIEKITDHCWGKLFKFECIKDLCFEESIAFGEDKLFTTLAVQNTKNIAVLTNQLYFYFDNPNSAVNTMEHNLFLPAVVFLEDAKNKQHRLSLKYAYTGFLSFRYINMFKPNSKEIRKDCNRKLKECKIIARNLLSFKERILLNLFTDFAFLYRSYRIISDHTMIDWEKSQKRKYAGIHSLNK